MTDNLLGTLHHDFEERPIGNRDALHVPVVLVTSLQSLRAGDRVLFTNESATQVSLARTQTYHGVVDPFLETHTEKDAAFFVLVSPHLASCVRHDFQIEGYPKDLASDRIRLKEELRREIQEDIRRELIAESELEEDDGCRGCY